MTGHIWFAQQSGLYNDHCPDIHVKCVYNQVDDIDQLTHADQRNWYALSTTTITIRLYVDSVVMSSDWIQLQYIYESYNELLNKLLNESYKVRVRVRVMQYNTMCTSIQNTSQP
ncbi:hypothetical protein BDEG_27432 [Batrachochytrium dendrobatidis JEL423]|uniref:Uncharacterized protein n=1 Tax=Batrachochytrium dendrobatidis (strain JEL423) TaxID=403673 RepID=A0A177WW53_BATDL|nr:hypothetical protein BDEG_27432 [Batrachochytrium dendrobatidis JEL423]